MTPKLDLFVCLQYRDKLSVGSNRVRLGRRAFHWSIVAVVDGSFHRFDVTDGIVQNPNTFEDINPDRKWVYRHNVCEALSEIPRYLGSVQINQKSTDTSISTLERIIENVPMPDNDNDRARSNCVSWTVDVIGALQLAGYCQNFDLNEFQSFALTHADRRLADFKNKEDPVRYPQSTNRWLRLF